MESWVDISEFIDLVEEGSFTAAEHKLSTGKSNISKKLVKTPLINNMFMHNKAFMASEEKISDYCSCYTNEYPKLLLPRSNFVAVGA